MTPIEYPPKEHQYTYPPDSSTAGSVNAARPDSELAHVRKWLAKLLLSSINAYRYCVVHRQIVAGVPDRHGMCWIDYCNDRHVPSEEEDGRYQGRGTYHGCKLNQIDADDLAALSGDAGGPLSEAMSRSYQAAQQIRETVLNKQGTRYQNRTEQNKTLESRLILGSQATGQGLKHNPHHSIPWQREVWGSSAKEEYGTGQVTIPVRAPNVTLDNPKLVPSEEEEKVQRQLARYGRQLTPEEEEEERQAEAKGLAYQPSTYPTYARRIP